MIHVEKVAGNEYFFFFLVTKYPDYSGKLFNPVMPFNGRNLLYQALHSDIVQYNNLRWSYISVYPTVLVIKGLKLIRAKKMKCEK